MECKFCKTAKETGWWGTSKFTHCRDCHFTWSRTSTEAHCAICHRHFGGARGFDMHFGPNDEHKDPIEQGRPFRQDERGVWRREPPPQASPGMAESLP